MNVCSRTIIRRLAEAGLFCRVACVKYHISEKNRVARLAFARKYIDKPAEFWHSWAFSDESPYQLLQKNGKVIVYLEVGARYEKQNLMPSFKSVDRRKVMVWGAFSWKGVGDLYWVQETMTGKIYVKIIRRFLKSSAKKCCPTYPDFFWQEDNDPKHTSGVAQEYFRRNKVNLVQWPSQSPDLNPIEHLWDVLDHEVRKLHPERFRSEEALFSSLQEAWNILDLDMMQTLISSMPRRLQAVIDNDGYPTKY